MKSQADHNILWLNSCLHFTSLLKFIGTVCRLDWCSPRDVDQGCQALTSPSSNHNPDRNLKAVEHNFSPPGAINWTGHVTCCAFITATSYTGQWATTKSRSQYVSSYTACVLDVAVGNYDVCIAGILHNKVMTTAEIPAILMIIECRFLGTA